MLLIQIVVCYEALNKLSETEMDFDSAYKLSTLKGKLEKDMTFYAGKEMELAKKYGKKDESGNLIVKPDGRFDFETPESGMKYRQERSNLAAVEVEYNSEPIEIKKPNVITAKIIEALKGFVAFV